MQPSGSLNHSNTRHGLDLKWLWTDSGIARNDSGASSLFGLSFIWDKVTDEAKDGVVNDGITRSWLYWEDEWANVDP